MPKSSQTGFSLIELVVTIAVVAVIASVAIPNFQDVMRNNRISATTNELLASLRMASSASNGSKFVSICAAKAGACIGGTDWSGGWLVFQEKKVPATGVYNSSGGNPDTLLQRVDGTSNGIAISADAGSLTYGSMSPQSTRQFFVTASGCKGSNKREINVTAKLTPSVKTVGC